jgi:hypothetical protein
MRQDGHKPPDRRALQDFIDAVHALSDDPRPANLERYLGSSRALDESRRSRQPAPAGGSRPKGARGSTRRAVALEDG